MKSTKNKRNNNSAGLEKTRSGLRGLDEITNGGLPKGRPTLLCGSAGCGKTMMAMEFLVRGAMLYQEPGVFMAFEETEEELAKNVASLGFDLKSLCDKKMLALDYVHIERSEIEETGEYDLEGLFVRLENAIDSVGAKRVVMDTIEALFAGLPNEMVLRSELRRLFRWLKEKRVTAIITAEQGHDGITRHGLEEYVADCVILLDHRVCEQISRRRLRIIKYRGSLHGTNEYPFLISKEGISVLPITSLGLTHQATQERISTGIPRLDTMFAGKGYYRGSSILLSGTAGTGKTSVAAAFVDAAARRGEKSVYFAFEESPSQIIRNMRSIGIDLEPWLKKSLLTFHASRPTLHGLEMHLLVLHKIVQEIKPRVVVIDPMTSLTAVGNESEVKAMLTRIIDSFKTEKITALFTSLTVADNPAGESEAGVSSLMDTWLLLRNLESSGERNRGLYILKSRGMAHSNQVREFVLSNQGINLVDVYVGPGALLTGSARLTQEAQDKAEAILREKAMECRKRELGRERQAAQAQIAALHAGVEAKVAQLKQELAEETLRQANLSEEQKQLGRQRMADAPLKAERKRDQGKKEKRA